MLSRTCTLSVRASTQLPARWMSAAAAASSTHSRLSEAALQQRAYKKEMSRLRREYKSELEAARAIEKKQLQQDLTATEAQKQQHHTEKLTRSLEKQAEANIRQEQLMQQKQQERKAREQNRLLYEQKLSADRMRLVSFLRESSKSWITLDNLDRRLNDSFFQNPVPWKFEFIPFCAPESPYWKENVNPLYSERQVSLKRLQDMMESTREDVRSALTEDDLSRLQASGLLLDLQDNVKWVAGRQDANSSAFNQSVSSFKNSTIVNDDEEYPMDDFMDFFNSLNHEDEDGWE